jgi:hypothetical protein
LLSCCDELSTQNWSGQGLAVRSDTSPPKAQSPMIAQARVLIR